VDSTIIFFIFYVSLSLQMKQMEQDINKEDINS